MGNIVKWNIYAIIQHTNKLIQISISNVQYIMERGHIIKTLLKCLIRIKYDNMHLGPYKEFLKLKYLLPIYFV